MKQEEPKSLVCISSLYKMIQLRKSKIFQVIVLVPLLDAVDFLKVCQRTVIPFIIASKLWQGLEKVKTQERLESYFQSFIFASF